MRDLRRLLWLYLWLLLFEGALRKWIIPSLDAPLLIVRDPLVVWIYIVALQKGYSFRNAFVIPTIILAIVSGLASVLFGEGTLFVTAYGLRTDFLQIPLIFLIPQILNRDDVIEMGRFLLKMAIPISLLVLVQFRSPPEALVNKGAFRTHYGTVRPSGTFSFIPGLVSFYATVASFVFFGFLRQGIYKIWLVGIVTFFLLLGSSVSGSRSCLVSVGIVAAAAVFCGAIIGRGVKGILVAAVMIVVLLPVLSLIPAFNDGYTQLMRRFTDAGNVEGGTNGFVGRYADTMVGPLEAMVDTPFFGSGLGLGTNAGQAIMTGGRSISFAAGSENEWGRIVYENGPPLGAFFILLRLALTFTLGSAALRELRRGNVLPMLIFASCGLLIMNGQWGVPTTLGFSIFGGGMTLAACNDPEDEEDEEEYEEGEHGDDDEGSDHSSEPDHVA